MGENSKKFSIKKLLLTIMYSIIVTTFLGTTFLFISSISSYFQSEVMGALDQGSEALINIGKDYEGSIEKIEQFVAEEKALYGADYPSEEIFFCRLIAMYSSYGIVRTFIFTLISGIIIGTIIYIVAIQNAKNKKLLIELLVSFIVIFAIIMLANMGYQAFLNNFIKQYNTTQTEYHTYIFDLENQNIFLPYIITILVVYIGNMIYQKVQTNKLNKELNKK